MNRPAPVRRAVFIWVGAMCAYITAIAGRTSLGVAGVVALERFQLSASALAVFATVQLAVYASAQIPVGLLLDRRGPRQVMTIGALILASGQLLLAFATTFEVALMARILVGAGDAAAFICVVRLVPSWFSLRRIPLVTQLTAIFGQLGQVISALPFAAILGFSGWRPAFLSLAGAGIFAALIVFAVVRDTPNPTPRATKEASKTRVGEALKAVLRNPGTWVGFSAHYITMFPNSVFTLLWGVPFMTLGLGIEKAAASGVLVVATVAIMISGPIAGALVGASQRYRTPIVLLSTTVILLAYALVLVPSRPVALPVVAIFAALVSAFSTSGNIAFDYVRTSVPNRYLGTATGVANTGGFIATFTSLQLIGWVLDLHGGAQAAGYQGFRIALATPVAVWAVGMLIFAFAHHRLKMAQRTTPRQRRTLPVRPRPERSERPERPE